MKLPSFQNPGQIYLQRACIKSFLLLQLRHKELGRLQVHRVRVYGYIWTDRRELEGLCTLFGASAPLVSGAKPSACLQVLTAVVLLKDGCSSFSSSWPCLLSI